ncbi:MAG: hypothetical protein AB8G11_09685 [Saprospiraceae bacterium]
MNKNLLQSLAKMAKVTDVEAFSKALQSETDTDFKLDTENLIVRTKEEEESFKSNLTNLVKDKAFSDAFEIQIKNMKKEVGLEFEGKKSKDFMEAYKSKILEEANIEPNNRISELENTLKTVTQSLEKKDTEYAQLKNGFSLEKNRLKAESLIPNLPESIGLDKKEVADLFFLKHEVKDDGIYKDGERLINQTTAQPFQIEDAVNNFISERGWNKQPSGRGGGSQQGQDPINKISSLDEFNSLAESKGYRQGSQEYNSMLAEKIKENPDLVQIN